MRDNSKISLSYVCSKEGNKYIEEVLFVVLFNYNDKITEYDSEELTRAFFCWYDDYRISRNFNIDDVLLSYEERKEYNEIADYEVNTEYIIAFLFGKFLRYIEADDVSFDVKEIKRIIYEYSIFKKIKQHSEDFVNGNSVQMQ